MLRGIECGLRAEQARSIGGIRRVFKFRAVGLHKLLGIGDALFDSRIFARFHVRKFFLSWKNSTMQMTYRQQSEG